MTDEIAWLTVGMDKRRVATIARAGSAPGIVWLGGFRSDMMGTKAVVLDAYAAEKGIAYSRFDYSGQGQSEGVFEDGTISRWLEDAEAAFAVTAGPQILVGSSMGGWLSLLLADAERRKPGGGRVAGLVLIAPAVDMTRALIWDAMPKAARRELAEAGIYYAPNAHGGTPVPITKTLIDDGEKHLFGDRLIEVGCPVHILQGMRDAEVPWRDANGLVERLASDDVVLTLVKDGDHRLSRPEDLARIRDALDELIAVIGE